MALYGAFSSSVLGMMSQSSALHNIGANVSNVNTGGFKRTDTNFSTVLSRTMENISDIGGVRPHNTATITQQGYVVSSQSDTDVAISGQGFFALNTEQDGSGTDLYTRDGSFGIAPVNDISVTGIGNTAVTTKDGYLVDKNGYFVQGWAYANGSVTTTGTPKSLRVDQYAFVNQFEATTSGTLNLNLPAGDTVGHVNQYDIALVDSAGKAQSAKLNFSRTGTNAWNVTTTTSRTAVAQVDTVTMTAPTIEAGDVYTITVNNVSESYTTNGAEANVDAIRDALISQINSNAQFDTIATAAAGTAGQITLTAATAGTALTSTTSAVNGGATADNTSTVATTTANVTNTQTTAATAITFSSTGLVQTPTTLNLSLSFAGGSTASMALDISDMTQFYGDFLPTSYTKNGFASANMASFSFDKTGNVIGTFEDGSFRKIYKLSLGVFSNPNGLDARNGNVFAESPDSGVVKLTTAGNNGYAVISPNAKELSNVDIAEEFTKMMMTQTAYNASSNVFKTTDEMTIVARDLKR
ncbi:MAG: flagellar hook-basal body complex protein [Rhodospirillales bacterium]|nr:flagellar hook-basal body complex protein [Rhodospirillales bacterium]